jgi:MoxR-like ATPase
MGSRKLDVSLLDKKWYEDLPEMQKIEPANLSKDKIINHNFEPLSVKKEPYLPSEEIIKVVNLSITLGRPLLLQGEPGCGKTRLAYFIAYALGLPLEISYIKSTSRAKDLLYNYDAVARLYDAQIKKRASEEQLDKRKYIELGPLGRAIVRAQAGRRSVVLIDEIDKADIDFPNDLLWELDQLEFAIPELGEEYMAGDDPTVRPIVIVTDNEEKALPVAFLRRCIFHYMEFPKSLEKLQEIIALHHSVEAPLSTKAIEIIEKLRDLDLKKKPGLSELIDWVSFAQASNLSEKDLENLEYVGAVLKHNQDQVSAEKYLAKEKK